MTVAVLALPLAASGIAAAPALAASSYAVTATIPVGNIPVGVAVDAVAGTVYVTNGIDNTVSVIDAATGTVTATVPVGTIPFQVAADPAAGTAYMANIGGNTLSVIGYVTQTTTTVTSSKNPSAAGHTVTLTAMVTPSDGGGTVRFQDDGTDITGCSAEKLALVSSSYQATCATSTLPAGADKITASYTGDPLYAGSTSPAVTQTVVRTATATTLTSSRNPDSYGQPVTFTATVTPTDGNGTVSFTSGTAAIGGCTARPLRQLTGNYQASCTTSTLSAGSHAITARYTGDTIYAASASAPLAQTVRRAATRLTADITFNNQQTFTVTGTLTSRGRAVAGKRLTISTGRARLCTATTGRHGTASCVLTYAQSIAIRQNSGRYTVTFAGTPDYDPATANGQAIIYP